MTREGLPPNYDSTLYRIQSLTPRQLCARLNLKGDSPICWVDLGNRKVPRQLVAFADLQVDTQLLEAYSRPSATPVRYLCAFRRSTDALLGVIKYYVYDDGAAIDYINQDVGLESLSTPALEYAYIRLLGDHPTVYQSFIKPITSTGAYLLRVAWADPNTAVIECRCKVDPTTGEVSKVKWLYPHDYKRVDAAREKGYRVVVVQDINYDPRCWAIAPELLNTYPE